MQVSGGVRGKEDGTASAKVPGNRATEEKQEGQWAAGESTSVSSEWVGDRRDLLATVRTPGLF